MLRTSVLLLFAPLLLLIPSPGAAQDVLTGGYGNDRANAALNETILSPATVGPSSFGRIFSLAVDGQIYAQPLFQRNLRINGVAHNVVFVATMHNSVYAFDGDRPGLPLWTVSLGTSVPTALYAGLDGPYSDILPEAGILSTPVIDPVTGTLYVVAATWENGVFVYRLHALDTASGAERFGAPVEIQASVIGIGDGSANATVAFSAAQHLQRPALLLARGSVYVAFGSHGDAPPYHGWIMAYSAQNVQHQAAVLATTPNGAGGAIWQGGRGLTADTGGNIFAVTSNGDTDDHHDFSDSVLRLQASDLTVADWFAPFNVQTLNDTDDDLGACGVVLISGTPYMVTGGKQGIVYLMRQSALGGQSMDDSQTLQRLNVTGFGVFNLALWPRADGALLYTHGAADATKAWRLNGNAFGQTPVSQSPGAFDWPFQGMTVSANGSQPHSGILWVLAPDGSRLPTTGHLFAYDAEDLSHQLWDDTPGKFAKFANPTVASGKVYVPTMSNALVVYGLKPAARAYPSVTAIVNAASLAAGPVAAGELVTMTGENLCATPRVAFNGIDARITSSSATSLTAIVPSDVSATGQGSVTLICGSDQGVSFTTPLSATAPGIFGPGAILNPDLSVNSISNPAASGSQVAIYATGTGQSTPSVTVNGKPADIVYAGHAPQLPDSVVQINLRLPDGITGLASVQITAGANTSPAVTIAIGPLQSQ
jgi:uncharacterized protein (TIGR03437 family)